MPTNRPLRVFLCHSSNDKPAVRELYQKLRAEAWIEPWLDEEELYPGQDWETEIEKAVELSDVVLVCLSNGSINKRGFVQKELRFALDVALEMPEETIFIIPLRLEDCTPPRSLRDWQYANYFEGQRERGLERLLVSLQRRADSLGLKFEIPAEKKAQPVEKEQNATEKYLNDVHKQYAKPLEEYKNEKITLSNGMEFMRVPAGKFVMGSEYGHKDEMPQHIVDIHYDYWMSRFPLTNNLYNDYVKERNIKHPVLNWKIEKDHPVTNVKWIDVIEYCSWLNQLIKLEISSGLVLRLPTEAEWEKAARGTDGREYPWGNTFDKNKCNSYEGKKGDTTPVNLYSPTGDSPYGCADMSGNIWEWSHSLYKSYPYKNNDGREDEKDISVRTLRGGSYNGWDRDLRCARRNMSHPNSGYDFIGFRVCLAPSISI